MYKSLFPNNKKKSTVSALIHSDSALFDVQNITKPENFGPDLNCIIFFTESKKISIEINTAYQPNGTAINREISKLLTQTKTIPAIFGVFVFNIHPILIIRDMENYLDSDIFSRHTTLHILITNATDEELLGKDYFETNILLKQCIHKGLNTKTAQCFSLVRSPNAVKYVNNKNTSAPEFFLTVSTTLREVKKYNKQKEYFKSCFLLLKLYKQIKNTEWIQHFDLPLADLCLETGNHLYKAAVSSDIKYLKNILNKAITLFRIAQELFQKRGYYEVQNECDYMMGYCYLMLHDHLSYEDGTGYLKKAEEHMLRASVFLQNEEDYDGAAALMQTVIERNKDELYRVPPNLLPLKIKTLIQNAEKTLTITKKSIPALTAASNLLTQAKALLKKLSKNEDNSTPIQNLWDCYYLTKFKLNFELALCYKKESLIDALITMKTAERILCKSSLKNNYRNRAIISHHIGIIYNKINDTNAYNPPLRIAYRFYKRANMTKEAQSLINKFNPDEGEKEPPMRKHWCKLASAIQKNPTKENVLALVELHGILKKRELPEEDRDELRAIFAPPEQTSP